MKTELLEFKDRIANDQLTLNEIRELSTNQDFEDVLFNKSKLWGYNLSKQDIINEMLGAVSTSEKYYVSVEQIDANPSYSEFNGCTDNSNLTAQRPSACLTCTTSNGGGCR